MKSALMKNRNIKKIPARVFDAKFDRGEDVFPYLDFKKATVVKRDGEPQLRHSEGLDSGSSPE